MIAIAMTLLALSSAQAAEVSLETQDRNVDQVALQSQESAILKLKSLLKKYQRTPQEVQLLMRVAEVTQESASIQFRIAHSRQNKDKLDSQLIKYKSFLKNSVDYLNRLIKGYH